MKKTTKILALVLAMLLTMSMVIGCSNKSNVASGDEKTFTLTLVYEDGTSEDIAITTSAESLGDAMLQEELILEDEYSTGIVNTINGVEADYSRDESWWCVYDANGESAMVGIADIPVEDGATYKFVYTIGMG